MRKYLIAILVLIIAVSAPVNAEDSTVFTVEPSMNNGVVTVSVNYENNKLIHSGEIDIIYDSNKLKLVEVSKGAALSETLNEINDKLRENALRVVWAAAEVLPEKGCVLELEFKLIGNDFINSDIYAQNCEFGDANGRIVSNVIVKTTGVESVPSTNTKPEVTKPEDTKPAEDNKPTDDETPKADGADIQKPEINETDETLPLDKVPSEEEAALGFIDVTENDWFFDSVKYAKENKLMSGVSETEFAPNASVTRAMLVVVLHRIEEEPLVGGTQFTDVESGQWYSNAVAWAANEGIVNGVGEGKFAPNSDITREQIATILYKYSQKKSAIDAASVGIIAPDRDKISDWAMEGMSWAVAEKLITGKDGGVLDPGGKATRAEIATILMRFLNK